MRTLSHALRTLVAAGALACASLAPAHHGWSGYDSNTALNVEGVIREAGYEHPHGYVRLDTSDKTWLVVLAPPSRMENRGLAASLLETGARARVEGYPSRTDPQEMRAERITVGGKTVELR